jgi:hypothetical protein
MHGTRFHGRGRCGRRGHRRFPDAETLLRRRVVYQRDLEQETGDVADLIRRLKEEKAQPATV